MNKLLLLIMNKIECVSFFLIILNKHKEWMTLIFGYATESYNLNMVIYIIYRYYLF